MPQYFQMKKYLLILLLLSFCFSCKKDKDTGGGGGVVVNPVGDPPATFTKKLMLEVFKGEWNPNCPTGDDTLKAMLALDSNIVAACIHQGDWLAITPFFNALSMHLGGINSFPRAAMNRVPASKGNQLDSVVYSIFNWRINAEELLQTTSSDVGLAISSKELNNNLEVSVFVGYNDSIKKRTRLTVYLVEDSVKAQNQLNADTNYIHQRVLRKVLSSHTGDSIAMFDGKMITKNYSMTLGGYYNNKSNLRIVAFVNIIGDDFKYNEILNAQQAKLNEVKKWD
jgi:hypothetical protein